MLLDPKHKHQDLTKESVILEMDPDSQTVKLTINAHADNKADEKHKVSILRLNFSMQQFFTKI